MMADEFLADLLPQLASRRTDQVVEVAMAAVAVAAWKQHSTPRDILDELWKAMDETRYEQAMKPCLDHLLPSAL